MFDYWDAAQKEAANLYVELLHLNGAQDNPGGVNQLTGFLGNVNANPPTQGSFQNTRDAERKLMFPALPVGTVINTEDRLMWANGLPGRRRSGLSNGPVPPVPSLFNSPLLGISLSLGKEYTVGFLRRSPRYSR